MCRIKEKNLTENGYFDISKIEGLRVYSGGLLRKYRLFANKTQCGLAEMFGVSTASIRCWENGRNSVPFEALMRTASMSGISKNALLEDIEKTQPKMCIRGSLPEIFSLRKDKIPYVKNFIPYKDTRAYSRVLRNCKSMLMMNKFLTTFFEYKKEPKIAPPLTEISTEWVDTGIDMDVPISVLLVTEGCKSGRVNAGFKFVNNSKYMHDILLDCIYFRYKSLPSSYFIKIYKYRKNPTFVTYYENKGHVQIAKSIMTIVGNIKTSPHETQAIDDYLKEPQPDMDFILSRHPKDRVVALKLFMAAEGSVYLSTRFGFAYPVFEIGCAHPKINEFLERLSASLGLHFKTQRSRRTWSGVKGTRARGIFTAIKMLQMDAFLEGVKITSKSKYFEGHEKREVLLAILELHKRQERDKSLFGIPGKEMNLELVKILKNKELKPAKFYIDYFSKKKKVSNWLDNG